MLTPQTFRICSIYPKNNACRCELGRAGPPGSSSRLRIEHGRMKACTSTAWHGPDTASPGSCIRWKTLPGWPADLRLEVREYSTSESDH
jgi:hypothetical protein